MGQVVHKKLSYVNFCRNGFRNGLSGNAFVDLSSKPCRYRRRGIRQKMKIIELFQHANLELKASTKCKIATFAIVIVSLACVLYVSIKDIVVYVNHDPNNPNSTLPPIPPRMHG
ncbi:hypothetical protein AVEN_193591-1 [Araneus ventricosus]|uniref:Uncharacterized protein n=1 Tax=Araneus ventricosus TaxID=182803 RepID=A0A4Y2MWV2_ARAVE|nr:hypothetical protein AVEN_193591-1 [Araneus ventricosus]